MKRYDLPVNYELLNGKHRKLVREQYILEQDNMCMYCGTSLSLSAPTEITDKEIDWSLFPPFFLTHPIHLQHNHDTGMTEGAVHAYCNAVLWQYEGR